MAKNAETTIIAMAISQPKKQKTLGLAKLRGRVKKRRQPPKKRGQQVER